MKIFIKVVKGDGCIIDVSDNSTILDLKTRIENDLLIPVPQQTLVLFGRILADEKPINFYETIKDGTKLNVIVKKPESLNIVMNQFLQKYYPEEQSKIICDKFMKDFERRIGNLSPENIKELATAYLNDEDKNEDK